MVSMSVNGEHGQRVAGELIFIKLSLATCKKGLERLQRRSIQLRTDTIKVSAKELTDCAVWLAEMRTDWAEIEAKRRRAMVVPLELVALEMATWEWSWSGSKARKRWARSTLRFDGAREERTRRGISLRSLRKVRLLKLLGPRSGNADHMQICRHSYAAVSQTVCRSYADVEESMQNLKNPCDSYNEFSSKELMCESTSPSAPRSPGNSGQEIENDIMTSFAPVFEQRLHDALEPILGPVACELRSQGEEPRKERERLIALEKQKLALNLKELERLQRVLAECSVAGGHHPHSSVGADKAKGIV